jgi:hypothetical protein
MQLWALDTIHYAAFNNTGKCTVLYTPKDTLMYTSDCTRFDTPSLLDICSILSTQNSSKCTASTLSSMPASSFWSSLPGMLSRMLPLVLDGILPAYLAPRSQVYNQEGWQSQFYLTTCSHVSADMLNPEPCWVADGRQWEASVAGSRQQETLVAGTRNQMGWGRWSMVDSVWWVAYCKWQMVGSVYWLDQNLSKYHSLNRIFSAAIMKWLYDTSWTSCWQL